MLVELKKYQGHRKFLTLDDLAHNDKQVIVECYRFT